MVDAGFEAAKPRRGPASTNVQGATCPWGTTVEPMEGETGSADGVPAAGNGSPPYWDGHQWIVWDGSQWLSWNGEVWRPATSAVDPAPEATSASESESPIYPVYQQGGGLPGWVRVVGLLLAFLAIVVALQLWRSGNLNRLFSGGSPTSAASSTKLAVYSVEGSGSAGLVTYTTPTGMEQVSAAAPWTRSLVVQRGTPLSISAQNGGEYGSVTCRITVDGLTVSTNTSTADYGTASCSTLP